MQKQGIERLRDRVKYFAERAREKTGPGFKYSAMLPDGEVQHYEITNLRDLYSLEHDVSTWCVWVWSLKDYVRNEAQRAGKPGDWWKAKVKNSQALQVCADLANREKHEELNREWTNLQLQLGSPKFTIPQKALGSLTFTADTAIIDTADPELVEFEVPVLDGFGNRVGDALQILHEAVDAWDCAIAEL
jgi:hypothetical protein